MKKKQMVHQVMKPHFIKVLMVCALLLGGCTSTEQKEMALAKTEASNGHYTDAISHLEKVITRSPNSHLGVEAAKEAARICYYDLKDFPKAIQFYQKIVLSSQNAEERMSAQKQIVSIYFDQLMDYPKSVLEINKLIVMLEDPKDRSEYKIRLARAYYYQNNFTQAENEVEEFLRTNPTSEQRFDMIFLKGNIELAKKDLQSAVEIFKSLLQEFPEKSLKDNVGLTLSVCFEELKDFKSAIDVLEKIKDNHPMPEYIEVRIKRLKERLQNQPGAKGRIRK